MVAEVFAGVGSIKAAFDIAKGLKDIDDAARRNAAIIALQEKILSAHATQSDLIDAVSDLKKQVANLEAWEVEKQRYDLKAITEGSFAYALKPDAQGAEPPHYICAACYSRGKKSILQKIPANTAQRQLGIPTKYHCSECKADVVAPADKWG